MYRTKLARTLLVLGIGGSPACERAADSVSPPSTRAPVVDHSGHPAVGNIGQTGRPSRQPLIDRMGRPVVGNIGQTGRPARAAAIAPTVSRPPARPRVATVRRPVVDHRERPAVGNIGQTGAPPLQLSSSVEARQELRPLVNRERRPATGNVMGKADDSERAPEPVLALQSEVPVAQQDIVRPLVTRERRPATGNTVSKGRPRHHDDDLAASQFSTGQPLVNSEQRPAVGNTMKKCYPCNDREAIDVYERSVRQFDELATQTTDPTRLAWIKARRAESQREVAAARNRLERAARAARRDGR
jgi:hypothetical protein